MLDPLHKAAGLRHLKVFSLKQPLNSLMRIILLGVCFVLTVFGTYGTMRGGMNVTGESYLRLAYPAAIGLFLVLLASKWLSRPMLRFYAFRYPEGALMAFFYGLSFVTLLNAAQKFVSTSIAAIGALVTVLAISNHVTTRTRFHIAIHLVCMYIWVTSLLAFAAGVQSYYVGAFTAGPIYIEYNPIFWRVNSWFITSTAFGVFQTYGILAAWYLFAVSRQLWAKAIMFASIPILVFGMGLSGARTAFAMLIVTLLTMAVARLSLRRRYMLIALAVLFVIVLAVYLLAPYWEQFYVLRRFFSEGGDTASLGGRGDMWDTAVPKFFALPLFQVLFGGGLGAFQEVLNSPVGAHSGLLRILVEHGLLGLGFFLSMITILSWKLFMLVRYQRTPSPEQRLFFMFTVLFMSGELVVQQLMGISMDTLVFYTFFSLSLADRKLRFIEQDQLRLLHA